MWRPPRQKRERSGAPMQLKDKNASVPSGPATTPSI